MCSSDLAGTPSLALLVLASCVASIGSAGTIPARAQTPDLSVSPASAPAAVDSAAPRASVGPIAEPTVPGAPAAPTAEQAARGAPAAPTAETTAPGAPAAPTTDPSASAAPTADSSAETEMSSRAAPKTDPRRVAALLVNGGGRAATNYQSHVLNLRAVLHWLERAGVPPSRITVLSSDGEDPGADLAVREVGAGDGADLLLGTRLEGSHGRPMETVSTHIDGVHLEPEIGRAHV